MKMQRWLSLGLVASTSLTMVHSADAALSWTILADQTVVSTSSESLTRSLRGLALSNDEQTLYGGFIQKSTGAKVVRYDLAGDPPVGTSAQTFNVTNGAIGSSSADHQPKAVAVDSRGIVFVGSSKDSTSGDNARILVLSPTLSATAGTYTKVVLPDLTATPSGFTGETVEGLKVQTVGGVEYLYASRQHEDSAIIERYTIGGTGAGDATLTLDPTFSGDGRFNLITEGGIADARQLYGMDVDADGNIFVASRDDSIVYRISSDLTDVKSAAVTEAMDVAFYDGRVFVTSYNGANSEIVELLASDLQFLSSFDAFADFPRGPFGNEPGTGYSGIEIDSQGRIYLADQFYFFNEAPFAGQVPLPLEKNDRILVSSPIGALVLPAIVPEPASMSLLVIAGVAMLRRRRQMTV